MIIVKRRDRSKLTGQIRGRVRTISADGLKLCAELKEKYGEDRKRNPEYIKLRDGLYDKYGTLKRHPQRWFEKILDLPGRPMVFHHNIVTDEGDALIADLMAQTPAKTKVDNTNGHIAVGTGWTGTTPKQNLAVNTATGSPEIMDATYPKLKGAWGAADDNVIQYRATFEAGDLNVVGIDEASLGNNAAEASADMLAYGQITPAVDVTTADTLQVDWEITPLGA